MAGGATADCAAVACCCPCGVLNLTVLAVNKVPAGLCRKALRKQRWLLKKGIMQPRGGDDYGDYFFRLDSSVSSSSVSTAFDLSPYENRIPPAERNLCFRRAFCNYFLIQFIQFHCRRAKLN